MKRLHLERERESGAYKGIERSSSRRGRLLNSKRLRVWEPLRDCGSSISSGISSTVSSGYSLCFSLSFIPLAQTLSLALTRALVTLDRLLLLLLPYEREYLGGALVALIKI